MKKIISLISLVSFAAGAYAHDGSFPLDTVLKPSLSNFKVSTSVAFESEYVFRGVKYAGYSVQPNVEVAYPIAGFDVYAGAWMNAPLEGEKPKASGNPTNLQEVDFYAGATYAYSFLTFDVGYSYYWYPSEKPGISRENEFYVGVTMDTASFLGGININPSVYYFYNLQYEASLIEASLGYEFGVGKYIGIDALTIPLRAYFGWDSMERYNGDQSCGPSTHGSYMYYGGSADLAYALNEYCTVSAGVRFAQHFGSHGDARDDLGDDKLLWYGVRVNFGF